MSEQNYNVNFFKPKTEHAKANMKVVISMLIVWGLAVFGFQILLNMTNKPTPEPVHDAFKQIWPAIQAGSATTDEQKTFARSLLAVLAKNIVVKSQDQVVLKQALAVTIRDLTADSTTPAAEAIGLGNEGMDLLLVNVLATSGVKEAPAALTPEITARIEPIMDLYLVHNRSGLTDTRFLGFPFHYWYTAQFLLILFVGLCWTYCFMADRSNAKFNLETEEKEIVKPAAPGTDAAAGKTGTSV